MLKPAIPKTTFIIGCLAGGLGAAALPLLLGFLRQPATAEPRLLPFQGRLTDAAGNGIGDGAKVVEFKMYDAPTGGNVKWPGEVHKLSVNGGLVNTMLGSKASLGSVDFAAPTFLQVTVDANGDGAITVADPPLLPRQSVMPAVYAAVAGQMQYIIPASGGNPPAVASAGWAAVFDNGRPDTGRILGNKLADGTVATPQLADGSVTADKLSGGLAVPVGGIIMWWGAVQSLPENFELCDGGAPAAGSILTGLKPDLRARFARGAPPTAVDVSTSPVLGGADLLNLEHSHDMTHTHDAGTLSALFCGLADDNISSSESIWYRTRTLPAINGVPWTWTSNRQIYVADSEQLAEETGSSAATTLDHGVVIGGTSGPSSTSQTGTALQSVDNRPAFLEVFYIIRVK